MTTSSIHEESGDQARLVLLIKRKRTKRQRSASPLMNVSTVSNVCSGERSSSSSQETREEAEACKDEDEDMANCLMLLSRGYDKPSDDRRISFLEDKKPMASLGLGLDGGYQCKTCDKSFHSFQALGGHRASHKKPKLEKKSPSSAVETVEAGGSNVGSFLSLQVTSNDGSKKQEKTHECSICQAEFSSGQALGGHMRRHRGLILNANASLTIKTAISSTSSPSHQYQEPKNFLELDLNLPAPEDESKFALAPSKNQILSFMGASNSLIDCHH